MKSKTYNRPWGFYLLHESVDLKDNESGDVMKVKTLFVNPGKSLSLQSHRYRAERWFALQGVGKAELDLSQFGRSEGLESHYEVFEPFLPGEALYVPKGAKHRLSNPGVTQFILLEIQIGDLADEDDITRYEESVTFLVPKPSDTGSYPGQSLPKLATDT